MTTDKPTFLLQGNGVVTNRGCEAIVRSTAALLREEFGPCRVINAPSHDILPVGFVERDPDIVHRAQAPYRPFNRDWFAMQWRKRILGQSGEAFEPYIARSLATLAIGGDNYSFDYGHPRAFFQYNRVTLNHAKPLVLWGASIGPFTREPAFEALAAEELRKVTLICARESETVAYLDSIGVRDNVRAVSDPAFTLRPESAPLSEAEQAILARPHLGLNFSPLLRKFYPGDWTATVTACLRSILRAVDLSVALIPHVIYRNDDDYAFMKRVMESLPEARERVLLIGPHYNAAQYKWIIARMAVFVGARTHATIAAFSSAVPTLSLGYSMKARGINKDLFGHTDWLVDSASLSPEALVERLGRLLREAPAVKAHLTAVMPGYQDRARLATRYLREVLGSAAPPAPAVASQRRGGKPELLGSR